MTPEQRQQAEETAAYFADARSDLSYAAVGSGSLAARCIRAVLEASKEENWAKMLSSAPCYGSARFESNWATVFKQQQHEMQNGFEYFQRAITGEPA